MFRLIPSIKRGCAPNVAGVWTPYQTLDVARAAARSLMRDERVIRVMITRDDVPPTFVEWVM
jgi:hypothetical protein